MHASLYLVFQRCFQYFTGASLIFGSVVADFEGKDKCNIIKADNSIIVLVHAHTIKLGHCLLHIFLNVLPWEHPAAIMQTFAMETGTMVPPSGTARSLQDLLNWQLSFALLSNTAIVSAKIIELATFI